MNTYTDPFTGYTRGNLYRDRRSNDGSSWEGTRHRVFWFPRWVSNLIWGTR